MITYNDSLVYLVGAANIAGHMEKAEHITIPDDEDLTMFLVKKVNEFLHLCEVMDYAPNWFTWIDEELEREYGSTK